MNYIVLEGISLWLVLFIIVLMLIISFISILCAVLADKRIFTLESLLYEESEKVRYLIKKNFILQLKSGEFDVNDK